MKTKTKTIFLVVAIMFSAHAFAGGAATGGASEWTQVLNNFELVSSVGKQSQMVAGQLKDYSMQTRQYMSMVQNLKGLAPSQVQQALAPYQKTLDTISDVYGATMDVYATSTRAEQVYNQRLNEMNRLKMDPTQYLANEMELAKSRGGIYQKKLNSDRSALQLAQEKSMKLVSMQTQVSSISGNVEGLQVLAQQNQMMAGELLELNTNLRQQNAEKNTNEIKKTEDDAKRQHLLDEVMKQSKETNARNMKMLEVPKK